MEMIIRNLVERLEAVHGRPVRREPAPCLETLVQCILSQHTSDRNSSAAYSHLRARFPTWRDILDSDDATVASVIRTGGLANSKARAIRRVLATIRDLEGDLTLERLRDLPTDQVLEYLLRLPGVGRKTAAIVLCFAMGRPVLPVDTHVHRVSRRLGLIPSGVSAEKAHDILGARVPKDLVYRFHVALIRHGRSICRARSPECHACVLAHGCPSHHGPDVEAARP